MDSHKFHFNQSIILDAVLRGVVKIVNLNKYFITGIIALSISILLSGVFIGNSIKENKVINDMKLTNLSPSESEVLNLSQVSKYLNMSENEVKSIISIEKNTLEMAHSFSGIMFPYFTVNNKYYFYKNATNEWVKDISQN